MKVYKRILWCLIMLSILGIREIDVFGEPIVDPTRSCSITIVKYGVQSIEDYDEPAIGEEQEISDLLPLQDIGFTVTRVQDSDTDANMATPLEGEGEYSQTLHTSASGKAEFTGLEQGIYLVKEMGSEAVAFPVDDFLVSLPMTNATGTNWLYDVFIYPKNQLATQPMMTMYVNQVGHMANSVAIGDTTNWISEVEIARDIATSRHFGLSYNLHAYIAYTNEPVVYIENLTGESVILTKDEDYTVIWDDRQMDITLTQEGKNQASTALEPSFHPYLYVKMETRLEIPNDQLEDAISTKIANHSVFNYVNSIAIESVMALEPQDSAYVYTGGFVISKVDSKSEVPLLGATFRLYATLEDAKAGVNALQRPNGQEEWQLTSDENGSVAFYGMPYGESGEEMEDAQREYYVVESVAPDGYNLLTSPVTVMVDQNSHRVGNEVVIGNSMGFTLPITGGVGTLLFSIIGIGLIVLAMYIYRRTRRHDR